MKPPFSSHGSENVIVDCQLADLGEKLLAFMPGFIIGVGSVALQAVFAAFEKLVSPPGEQVGFDLQLTAEHVEALASEQPHDSVGLLVCRPS